MESRQWDEGDLRRNLATVTARIEKAAVRAGRRPEEIRLLPVSKTVPLEGIRAAIAAGCTTLGENKVQEAEHKWESFPDVRWSVIGHLQTNKARDVARFAHEFQALDSLRVAEALDRRLQAEGRGLDVFVQVNTSGEASKFGLAPDEVADFVRRLPVYGSLRVRGLMTLAAFTSDLDRVRACFVLLRTVRDRLDLRLADLSMGMSGDFEAAIEEGATVVRVGQAVFGARNTPNSHYWPGLDQPT